METRDLVLAGLAAGGENATFSPVQVQKLFFILDQEASAHIEGPYFNFVPYDYGPFDREVYNELDNLARQGMLGVNHSGPYRTYTLTSQGFQYGNAVLDGLPKGVAVFFGRAANWVTSLSFNQLVSAIYRRYPQMKENSVFRA